MVDEFIARRESDAAGAAYGQRAATEQPKRRSLRPFMLVAALAFVLGIALAGWIASRAGFDFNELAPPGQRAAMAKTADTLPDRAIAGGDLPAAVATKVAEVKQAARAVQRVEQQQGGIDQRLAAAEQRLARLDLQAEAASGNAARAEGLLIAFAARRTLERGAELGYLADQLQLRFGDAMPGSVDKLVKASRNPVTLDRLLARLEGLSDELTEEPENSGGLARARRELSSLFVIRRESDPSPQPQRRLERARLFLESGRVQAAIAEVQKLPNAQAARSWMVDAARYAEIQNALDRVETAAVLEPRRLRDSGGNRVDQPSPAREAAN